MAPNSNIPLKIVPTTLGESRPCIIFVIGIPGAGKGTLCSLVANHTQFYHLSVGDYLRYLCASPEGYKDALNGHLSLRQLKNHVEKIHPADPKAIVSILKIKMQKEVANGKSNFLIDGFPRDIRAASVADFELNPRFVFHFDCPEEIAMQRFIERKRGDATGDKFKERVERLRPNLAQLIGHYKNLRRVKFERVDTNCSEEESKEHFLKLFEEKVLKECFNRLYFDYLLSRNGINRKSKPSEPPMWVVFIDAAASIADRTHKRVAAFAHNVWAKVMWMRQGRGVAYI